MFQKLAFESYQAIGMTFHSDNQCQMNRKQKQLPQLNQFSGHVKKKLKLNRIESCVQFECKMQTEISIQQNALFFHSALQHSSTLIYNTYIGTEKWFLALEMGLHSNYFSDFFYIICTFRS